MIDFTHSSITELAIHKVGNKFREEDVQFSESKVVVDDPELESVLMQYMLLPFKGHEMFKFTHASYLIQNEVYSFCRAMFEIPGMFFDNSKSIAKHLYEQSTHPKIKSGELYIVKLKDCKIDGVFCEAVGIFKSENRETFLRVKPNASSYDIQYEDGININKLDKGCIVFDIDKEGGFKVGVVDSQGSSEAQYWKNDFLGIVPCEDDYSNTQNYLNMCKSFVSEKLAEDFQVEKPDQIDMLNNSISFFKKNEKFSEDAFEQEVIREPGMIGAFNDYKKSYQTEKEITFDDEFEISTPAVKKQARNFKSIIKLDKNFHIYIHGSRELIEKGYDEATGMQFYKVFFKEES